MCIYLAQISWLFPGLLVFSRLTGDKVGALVDFVIVFVNVLVAL